MKTVIIHGHGLDSILFDTIHISDLYILNLQWKYLRKLCVRYGFILHGFPRMGFIDIPDVKEDEWKALWNEWVKVPIGRAFSWEFSHNTKLLYSYHDKLKNFHSPSYKYKPFIKTCSLCHNPREIKSDGESFCGTCYRWYRKKENLKKLNFLNNTFTVLHLSFSLLEDILKHNQIKEAYKIYNDITGKIYHSGYRKDRNLYLIYSDRGEMVFVLNRKILLNFIGYIKYDVFSTFTPSNIMFTITSAANDLNSRYDENMIKTGEFLLFCRKRMSVLREKHIPWHFQWVYNDNYIKMPKNLYQITEKLDRNSFNMLSICLKKLHSLFPLEYVKTLKDIFFQNNDENINYDISRFMFLCKNIEQKEFLYFLIDNAGYDNIRDILRYDSYFKKGIR
jgi:hypothetical protein